MLFRELERVAPPGPVVVSFHASPRARPLPAARVPELPRSAMLGVNPAPWSAGRALVAPDGGMFAFAGERFYGSLGATRPDRPIVALRETASGRGYWLVDAAGSVFAFGDARFCPAPAAAQSALPGVTAAPPLGHGIT